MARCCAVCCRLQHHSGDEKHFGGTLRRERAEKSLEDMFAHEDCAKWQRLEPEYEGILNISIFFFSKIITH